MERNTSTLRNILFDEIDGLKNGTSEPRRAMAVARLAQQIIQTAKVEMEFYRLQSKAEDAGKTLELGAMSLGERAALAVEHTTAACAPTAAKEPEPSE